MAEEDEEGEVRAEEQTEAHPNRQDGEGHGSNPSSEQGDSLLSWQATCKVSDNAITSLLLCIKQFMWITGHILCTVFASKIPKTLFSLRKWTDIL